MDLSYQVKLNENHDLFFGFKAGFNSYKANTDDLVTYGIQEDPSLMNHNGRFNPNFGIGVHLRHDKYFVSLSILKIFSRDRLEEEDGVATLSTDKKYLYLTEGVDISLGKNVAL